MLLSYVKFVNIISNESNQPFICNLAIIDNGYTFLMIHLYDLGAAKILAEWTFQEREKNQPLMFPVIVSPVIEILLTGLTISFMR